MTKFSSRGPNRSARVKSVARGGEKRESGHALAEQSQEQAGAPEAVPAIAQAHRRPLRNVGDDLARQAVRGWVQANTGALRRDELGLLFKKTADCAQHMVALLLEHQAVSSGRELRAAVRIPTKQRAPARAALPAIDEHRRSVLQLSQLMLDDPKILNLFNAMLEALMNKASRLAHLQLSLVLQHRALSALGAGLQHTKTLSSLSFRGSLMGDSALEMLKAGLKHNSSLESLDISGCDLTDASMSVLGAVLKAKASRCQSALFVGTLRQYPDQRLDRASRSHQHQEHLRRAATRLLRHESCLTHLDVSRNSIGDDGARRLFAAVSFDASLLRLDLSHNKMTAAVEADAVDAMRDHPCLLRLDLRHNEAPSLRLLKVKLRRERRRRSPRRQDPCWSSQSSDCQSTASHEAPDRTPIPAGAGAHGRPDAQGVGVRDSSACSPPRGSVDERGQRCTAARRTRASEKRGSDDPAAVDLLLRENTRLRALLQHQYTVDRHLRHTDRGGESLRAKKPRTLTTSREDVGGKGKSDRARNRPPRRSAHSESHHTINSGPGASQRMAPLRSRRCSAQRPVPAQNSSARVTQLLSSLSACHNPILRRIACSLTKLDAAVSTVESRCEAVPGWDSESDCDDV